MKNTFEIEKPTQRDVLYHRAKLQSNIYHDVLQRFAELAEESGFTQKQLAEAIGKDTAQINRLFAEPGNWTLATVSDLLIGMGSQLSHKVVSVHQVTANSVEIAASQQRVTSQQPVTFSGPNRVIEYTKTISNYQYAS